MLSAYHPSSLINTATAKILVVDDQPVNVQLLEHILEQEGWTVVTANSGIECLKKVEEEAPDLILLDVMMPKMDGIETCQRLRGNNQSHTIPIIFTTAKSTKADILEGLEAGAVDYITKPIDADELLARVRTQLAFLKIHTRNLELQKQLDEAKKTASIGAIMEGIAHNLNNLLAGSYGYADLIQANIHDPEKIEDNLCILKNSLSRMKSVIHQLTHVTHSTTLSPIPITLELLINTCRDECLGKYSDLAIVLNYQVDPKLIIHTAPEAFKDIFNQLAANAYEAYATDDKKYLQVTLSQKDKHLMIILSNAGRGIPKEIESVVFDPFVSTHATVGRGLGLTIAKQTAKNLGGNLKLVNSPEGVTVTWMHPINSHQDY